MMLPFKLALILAPFLLSSSFAQSKLSQCQLSWKPYIAGEEFPLNAVQLDGPLFVARVTSLFWFLGPRYAAGTANNDTKEATFVHPRSRGKVTAKSFDLLVNPNDCAVGWVDAFGEIKEPGFALQLERDRFVAMRKSRGKIVAGTLLVGAPNLFHAIDPESGQVNTNFLACEALKSTENLRLTVKNLHFVDQVEEEIPDFMGTDLIENESAAVLEHIVSHEKSVIIRYELSESHSFAQSTITTVGFGFNLIIVKVDVEWQNRHDFASGFMSSIVKEKEETVKSSRTIIVPSMTTVAACSVLFSAKSIDLPYTGEGIYGIKGRSSSYVEAILRSEGYAAAEIRGRNATHVFVNISGKFSIESPMRTKLVVFEPNNPEGCDAIQKSINQLNNARHFGRGNRAEIDTLKRKVKQLLHE